MTRSSLENLENSINDDLDLLKEGHILELENKPGTAKLSTIANRIKNNLVELLDGYDAQIRDQGKAADQEQFDLHAGLLSKLAEEISSLAKKQPDSKINSFKADSINRVLIPLKEIMKDEPSTKFLDLISVRDPNNKDDNQIWNTYSDVAIILSQYREACGEYRSKYYDTSWRINL